jgi:lipoprotein-releasing system ATP-binding protein
VALIERGRSDCILRADRVHRSLGSGEQATHILKGVSLDVLRNQYVSIVGASGSGKSTLLYLLGGLDRPSPDPAGKDPSRIYIGDSDTAALDDATLASLRNRLCGFVFQFHYLLKDFTAQENVALPMLKLGRLSRSEAYDRAHALLTRLGLGDKCRRRASKLSGGEQQRVALARALANEPEVLLADEPTGNLDKRNGELVADIFDELAGAGQAIVIVTHDAQLAARAGRQITMEDGRIRSDSRPTVAA